MKPRELLNIDDITHLFGIDEKEIYRKVSMARAGKIAFPLPVSKPNQPLCWDTETVDAYIKAKNAPYS